MLLLHLTSVSEHHRAAQKAFNWHRNEVPKSALQFGPVDTGRLGAGAVLAPGFGTRPYVKVTIERLK